MQQHFLLNTLLDFTPVLNSLKREVAFPGDILIWQDSIGDLFFILETGFVDIIKDGVKVAKLGPGKAFGELALINDINRTATVKACNVCIAWTLDRQTMRDVLANQETASRGNKIAFLKTVQMFVKLSDTTLGQIADVMKLVSYEQNDKIIKQGEVGDQFYIIQSGHALVTQGNKELARLSPGNCFGELALISNEPRKATVTAIDSLNCYTIDKQTFTSVLGTLKDAETQSTGITILRKVKLLEGLSEKQLVIISRSLETKDYENGENIVNQGDEGDKFYMIASGAVSIYVNHAEVARLNTGSYFGEMALMNDERRNATVTALGPVTCLTLNRSQFVKLLGPLDDILKEEARRREEAAKSSGLFGRLQRGLFQKRSSEKKISENPTTGVRFNLEEFSSVRILGTGRFGVVKLVQHNGSYKAYALKVLHKALLEEFKHEQAVINEKNLLQSLDHPFIPAIYGTFQDINSLYILLELIPGGDMWSILYDEAHHTQFSNPSKFGGIEVNMAKFYFCNILCAISYLHSNDIIYRDLKPENLVMDRTGYLKLVDFGSAKSLTSNSLTNTICGTPEYLAPEMLAARGHNRAVDFWAIGVFLYELLNRSTPFEQNDTVGIYQKIIHSEETLKECFKQQFDPYAKSLILQLLSNTPGLRIGMLRNGVDDVWNHPFLADVIADDILCKSIPPPLRPDMDRIMEQTELDKEHQNAEVIPYTGRFDFTSF